VAVVTDGGTLAAHASLVAREYGIPAVVATGDATTRLDDGQMVTVDGGAGTVHPTTDQASSSGGAAQRSTPAPSPRWLTGPSQGGEDRP
jgi:phosphoenolpyruvate-protein kinase (PTS system EI component)